MLVRAREPSDVILDLDRKVTRALVTGRGLTLGPDQLDVLVIIGLVDRLANARNKILEEQAHCRQQGTNTTAEDRSGSTTSEPPAVNRQAADSTSSGTIPEAVASSARARARAIFG